MKHTKIFDEEVLAPKRVAIDGLNAGSLSKVLIHYENPWWKAGGFELNPAWTQDEMDSMELPRDWARGVNIVLQYEGDDNYLTAWVKGDAAEVVDGLSDDEVRSNCAFATFRASSITDFSFSSGQERSLRTYPTTALRSLSAGR